MSALFLLHPSHLFNQSPAIYGEISTSSTKLGERVGKLKIYRGFSFVAVLKKEERLAEGIRVQTRWLSCAEQGTAGSVQKVGYSKTFWTETGKIFICVVLFCYCSFNNRILFSLIGKQRIRRVFPWIKLRLTYYMNKSLFAILIAWLGDQFLQFSCHWNNGSFCYV